MPTSPVKQLANKLLECEEGNIPQDLLNRLNTIATRTTRELNNSAGEFLHNLNDRKHTKEEVKCVIRLFPSALSFKKDARLPVQKAVCYKESLSFVPRLAKEGNALHVGGDDSHGGLLNTLPIDPGNVNAFQILAEGTFCVMSSGDRPGVGHDQVDLKYLRVLDELRTLNLLRKEHIEKYDLLGWASYPTSKRRFEFLVEWCPEALRTSKHKGVPLIHDTILRPVHTKPRQCFEMVLEAGMKHFSKQLGFLFRNHRAKAACESALEKFGTEDAMSIIRQFILPSAKHPILHHVAVHAPQYMNDFATYYPGAIYLRDKDKRLLFHTELATGTKNFASNSLFFLKATDDQIQEKDPVTGLFPFMLAASDNTSDLSAVYSLLIRSPRLAEVECTRIISNPLLKPKYRPSNGTINGASTTNYSERYQKRQQVVGKWKTKNTNLPHDESSELTIMANNLLTRPRSADVDLFENMSVRNRTQIFEAKKDVVKSRAQIFEKKKEEDNVVNVRTQVRRGNQKTRSPVFERIRGIEASISKNGVYRDPHPFPLTRV